MNERAARRGQAGSTLIESLIALILVSILVLALANGLFTSVTTDSASAEMQRMNAALTAFGETIQEEMDYQACGDAAWYTALYDELVLGATTKAARQEQFGTGAMTWVRVDSVEYWQSGGYSVDPVTGAVGMQMGSFSPNCAVDEGAQRMTLRVRYHGRERTAQVAKRNPGAVDYTALATAPTTTIAGNQTPIAAIKQPVVVGPCAGCMTFESTSRDPDGTIASYLWDFGDGTTATTENVTHTFSPGVCQVTLTVTDDLGAVSAPAKIPVRLDGQPSAVSGFRLARISHGGGTSASYDFAWDKLPCVQQYQIDIQWCINTLFFGVQCNTAESHYFGNAAGGTVTVGFPYVPLYAAKIRARVGSAWGPWSPDIRSWIP